MKTYIITMNVEEPLAKRAAEVLTGEMFHGGGKWPAILDQVSDFLSDKGFPPGIAQEATEVAEYVRHTTASDNWPSEEVNLYATAVFSNEPPSVEQWFGYYQNPSFRQGLSQEQAEKIFRTVLPATAVSYGLLAGLLEDYCLYQPEDLILLPNHTDVPGFDDLSYLLKDKDGVAENFEVYAEAFTAKELSWLYERNRDTVNRWLADQQVDLLELAEEHVGEDVCLAVTVLWATATINTYFQMYKQRTGCGITTPVVI